MNKTKRSPVTLPGSYLWWLRCQKVVELHKERILAIAYPGIVAQPELIEELIGCEVGGWYGIGQPIAIQMQIGQLGKATKTAVSYGGESVEASRKQIRK